MASNTERAPAWPFVRDAGGVWPMASGNALLEQEVKQAVLIPAQSMPMDKELGVGMERIVFMLDGTERDALLTDGAKRAIEGMVPRVLVDEAKATEDETQEGAVTARIAWRETESNVEQEASVEYRR